MSEGENKDQADFNKTTLFNDLTMKISAIYTILNLAK